MMVFQCRLLTVVSYSLFCILLAYCSCCSAFAIAINNGYSKVSSQLARTVLLRSSLQDDVPSSREESSTASQALSTSDRLRQEAGELLAKAQALRENIPQVDTTRTVGLIMSPWAIRTEQGDDDDNDEWVDYRLYVDIGREEGTWMDPRWGASGKRIEFTLDVRFLMGPNAVADQETAQGMVKDNFGGQSSGVYTLRTAEHARLRQGFDRMKCHGGAYRVDQATNGSCTVRFYVRVDGTTLETNNYGDVSVPAGSLFFSLPAFGGRTSCMSQLSRKEGPVSVRQFGWHTGLRREESRIVGVFRAVALADAQRRDMF